MYIKTIRLNNYRNIKSALIELAEGINIIYGNNAQGKTNIMESVFLSSTGRSHRTRNEKELIHSSEKSSNVRITVCKRGFVDNIDIYLKSGERKGIAINGSPLGRIGELFGELQTVIFSPEDLSLINDAPSERRRFIDMRVCQINKLYYYHLHTYYKILKQRNSLLKQKTREGFYENISVWDSQLEEHGNEIIKIRGNFIKLLNPTAKEIHGRLTGERETLTAEYKPCVLPEEFIKKLKKSIDKDIFYGSTSVGPHKDDIGFFINGKDVKIYGSQGQKRTTVLSCRLSEIELIKSETGDSPVLLLDDALSELDGGRQQKLIEYIGGIQTIITATGMEDLITGLKTGARIFKIEEGTISQKRE